ncbi:uracil-DNA glycosylase [Alloacidobacterium dinghuense]|uniref:Type-4 uracil-DNA glycosylase n=1 Tax=Alloacidobacterium dinghuense TaxID=2763107 RepID=A0A7G8BMK0_9BACT|nr:uracil-DNA glycosylase [Alloacidobacterium dinghuense]QNI33770.1 uracil-DNA glycosylase [Alloacidobacterium dinghuense]
MPRLDSEQQQAIAARIRYYRDLGVFDFYRRGDAVVEATPENVSLQVTNPDETMPRKQSRVQSQPSVNDLLPATQPVIPPAEREGALRVIREDIGECTRCPLAFAGRHTIVFGEGNANARLMFVGEGPGADEDAQGRPFVGRAGQLLNNMITAMGLKREDVYIANIVKCRPPQNRTPEPVEANTCSQFLFRQIDVIHPEILVALGSTAATYLLGGKAPLSALRGRVHEARGSKLIVTYHPAYLLRDPRQKKEAWADLQIAMAELGMKPPKRTPSE